MTTTLSFFAFVILRAEPWSAEWRQLRSQVVILQTLPSPRARLLCDWMVLEGDRGSNCLLTRWSRSPSITSIASGMRGYE